MQQPIKFERDPSICRDHLKPLPTNSHLYSNPKGEFVMELEGKHIHKVFIRNIDDLLNNINVTHHVAPNFILNYFTSDIGNG
ncbi:hypothetical protein F8M41_023087 [Gigaspora margarita]|uniref:Uncharacterized protein n=1 Tax=Gigaspora margarita TaxID=4874 RepID=A0A8H4EHH1_GIGMA|nr:hypothetical protein F8M41_023087 [Gigaspora margarita]